MIKCFVLYFYCTRISFQLPPQLIHHSHNTSTQWNKRNENIYDLCSLSKLINVIKQKIDTWHMSFQQLKNYFHISLLVSYFEQFLIQSILILFSQADASLTWYLQEKLQTISSIIPEPLRQGNILSELVTI